ncbi:terminase small subunit [Roseibium alexandrii]|uniref:Terminase small subunit n=1 Tax=Roseibium alexandrii TaxID=388408 RepID=A0A0M6ZXZ0_9HYPH|nr:terminase small subunit [Roseibium alexandrii]CTQ67157.1 Terminase small subunit [Roseibium alexandrii]
MADKALTIKQELFCLAYLKEGNASEAYRQAYDCENMKDTTIHRKAKDLLDNGKIRARVDQLNAEAVKMAVLNRSWVISRLMKVVEIGLNEDGSPAQVKQSKRKGDEAKSTEATQFNLAAATKALETLGKLRELRLFVDSKEHSGPGGGPIPTIDVNKLKGMSDKELDLLERALVQIGIVDGDPGRESQPEN